jgi:NADP-dependent 3-hydroxy acid dehydrogenase YdfG
VTALGGAIVTGASSGVGAAVARALARSGMSVALVARRFDRLRELVEEIEGFGGAALAMAADLGDRDLAAGAMEECCRRLGSVHSLILCHGTNVPGRRLDEMSAETWDEVIRTNLSSAFYCLRPVLDVMRRQEHGLVVAISSVAGLRPSVLSGAAYSASKAGLNALCDCINLEESAHHIRACVIAPGDINTEILDKRSRPPTPLARESMLQPDDVARLVVDLVTQPARVLVERIVVRPAPA